MFFSFLLSGDVDGCRFLTDAAVEDFAVIGVDDIASTEHAHHPFCIPFINYGDFFNAFDVEKFHGRIQRIVMGEKNYVAVADGPYMLSYPFSEVAVDEGLDVLKRDDPCESAGGRRRPGNKNFFLLCERSQRAD